jgi:predicted RNase H-like HicB family nuclease
MTKDLDYYKRLPYTRQWSNDDGECIVRIAEFPCIVGCGANKSEALADLRDTFDAMVSWAVEDGVDLPEPSRPFVDNKPRMVIEVVPAPMVPEAAVLVIPSSKPGAKKDPSVEVTGHVYRPNFDVLKGEPECIAL